MKVDKDDLFIEAIGIGLLLCSPFILTFYAGKWIYRHMPWELKKKKELDKEIHLLEEKLGLSVDFIAEWRVFVRYGKILDVRPYKGDWKVHYNPSVIENAVKDYVTAPNAYGMDFGVTSDGRTLLIEVNEGYALGCYGLFPHLYAKLIITRWAELTDTLNEYEYII